MGPWPTVQNFKGVPKYAVTQINTILMQCVFFKLILEKHVEQNIEV